MELSKLTGPIEVRRYCDLGICNHKAEWVSGPIFNRPGESHTDAYCEPHGQKAIAEPEETEDENV